MHLSELEIKNLIMQTHILFSFPMYPEAYFILAVVTINALAQDNQNIYYGKRDCRRKPVKEKDLDMLPKIMSRKKSMSQFNP